MSLNEDGPGVQPGEDFEGQLREAQQQLEVLQQQREQLEQQKCEMDELNRRKDILSKFWCWFVKSLRKIWFGR